MRTAHFVDGRRSVPKRRHFVHALQALALIALISGCTGNKKIVLLQDQTASKPSRALVDHSYDATWTPPKLQTGDIVSVAIDHYQLMESSESQNNMTEKGPMFQSVQHPYLIGFAVSDKGEIDLPILGKVKVGGLDTDGAAEAVRAVADNFYSSPSVKIFILNFTVTVLGEVNQPGRFPIYNEQVNVLNAIGAAGDMTPYADRSRIRIVRTRDGKNHLYNFDLLDETLLSNPNFILQPNDVIIIDPLRRRKYTGRDPAVVINVMAILVSLLGVYALLSR